MYLFEGRSSFRKCRSPGFCMSLSKCREWERSSLEGKKGGGREVCHSLLNMEVLILIALMCTCWSVERVGVERVGVERVGVEGCEAV